MHIEITRRLADVPAADWNGLTGTENPFLRHEFLLALEETGCVTRQSGWQPCHLLLRDNPGQVIGAMPLYLKTNSYGEFVFDWAWADAYRRSGLRYFPKLVSAVPFTPVTSARLLYRSDQQSGQVAAALLEGAVELARQTDSSSIHVLFPTADEKTSLSRAGFMARKDCQFHWHNRGYADFEAFLGEFTAGKRKKARRERRRVAEAGISFARLGGAEIDSELWAKLLPLCASSFWRRGREPYLNDAFFTRISAVLPDSVLAIVALLKGEPVATALCFRSADTLYGRYWGSQGDYHSLHFETCYYQGI
ncbi:MAG: GNAT family N-acetyltransferase, partial [Gammaproteobacteria bacterium]|nr:GNAT family N-acetyltransferase [Gammaproteobacteria bacterium]